jgi:hypothetical protein
MQFLDEDGLIHEAVPVHARLHVSLPFIEVYVVAG